MAANKYTDPILQVFVQGRAQITDMVYEDNFSVRGKEENRLVLTSLDSFKSITYTNIGSVTKILMKITPLTTVLVDPIVTLRLSINDGVNPPYVIDLPCRKFFYYMPDPSFSTFITGVQVSTTSTTEVQVEFRVYGE